MTSDQLSPHFSLRELVVTNVRGIDNVPHADVIERLRTLATVCLEPIRAQFGPLYVTSGYRSPDIFESDGSVTRGVNSTIGGAKDSAHMYGCAADLVPLEAGVQLDSMIAWVAKSPLPFDQVIIEHSGMSNWLHVGMLRPQHEAAPRRQVLRFNNGIYYPWVPSEET